MFKHLALVAALGAAFLTSAHALDEANVAKSFALKDGSTVVVFKDGKMSMQDARGRVVPMKPGHVMETRDGQKIIMIGNEVARLDFVLRSHVGGGQ